MIKEDLEKMFKIAKETERDVCIELTVPTREASEFIVILNDNLDYKLDYYIPDCYLVIEYNEATGHKDIEKDNKYLFKIILIILFIILLAIISIYFIGYFVRT